MNPDEVIHVGWDKDNKEKAEKIVKEFANWMQEHKDELTALQIFYNEPFRRRELTYSMLKEVLETLLREKPVLAPIHVWQAYEALGQCKGLFSYILFRLCGLSFSGDQFRVAG